MASASVMIATGGPRGTVTRLAFSPAWFLETIRAHLAEELEIGFGKLAQPLRATLTGQTTSPGKFDVLVLPGRDDRLAPISALAAAAAGMV